MKKTSQTKDYNFLFVKPFALEFTKTFWSIWFQLSLLLSDFSFLNSWKALKKKKDKERPTSKTFFQPYIKLVTWKKLTLPGNINELFKPVLLLVDNSQWSFMRNLLSCV
jgi:hypothetical protein